MLGCHFALDASQVKELRAADTAQDFVDELEASEPRWVYETDKAWDGIHRCLGDGESTIPYRVPMIVKAILGGEDLSDDEGNYSYFVAARFVPKVATALAPLTRAWFRARHRTLATTDYDGQVDDEDFDYLWSNFVGLRKFFARAAKAKRAVLFNVSG
jgi:hypothetical protein